MLILCEADLWPGLKGENRKITKRATQQIIIQNKIFSHIFGGGKLKCIPMNS